MRNALIFSAILLAGLTAAPPQGRAMDLAALNNRNELLLFSDLAPGRARTLPLQGVEGKLLGIDLRPANGQLYGLGTGGRLYTIDTTSGAAKPGPVLSVALEAVDHLVVDFNPQADRMRVIGSTGQSLRVNVDTGQAIVDGRLAYHASDRSAGRTPLVLAGAYINSYAGAASTQLFDFDSRNGAYVVQDPPNDGILRTIAPVRLGPEGLVVGADIFTDRRDEYHGFAMVNNRLHRFEVGTGALKALGRVGDGVTHIIDLAVLDRR